MASTPHRTIRVDDDLWTPFGEACDALGQTRTEVLIGCIRRYIAGADIIVGREPISGASAPHEQSAAVQSGASTRKTTRRKATT